MNSVLLQLNRNAILFHKVLNFIKSNYVALFLKKQKDKHLCCIRLIFVWISFFKNTWVYWEEHLEMIAEEGCMGYIS